MNRFQREVASLTLEQEKKVLKEIKSEYEKAVSEINDKVAQLIGRLQNEPENASSIIYQLNYQSAIRGQIGAILDNLKANNFTSIQDYLKTCYEDGFVGTFYDLQKQGLPIIFPIDQEQMVRAIVHDTKLSENLYNKLGQDVNDLKKNISSTISRGISTNDSYSNISRNIRIVGDTYSNKAYRIAKTEGHRITQEATHDAQIKAKDAGADIVKQWDAALDGRTRPAHRALDGQIKEIDEAFEYGGHKAMYPGGFGVGGLDINCRCVIIQRAKWAIDDEDDNFTKWDGVNKELLNLKSKNYEQFKKSYQKMVDDNNSLNDVTNRLLEKAKKAETGITKDLQEIIGSTNGTIAYDVGNGKTALDFRLKGGGSLKRKITSDFVTGVDLDDIEKSIYDNVRYTDLVDKDLLVDDYVKIQKQLEDKGYKIVRVKNTFDNPNSAYRGLNTVVEDPNGYKFELQFHTPESIEIKEKVHVLYEQFRLDSTSTAEKIRLNNEMLKISQSLPDIKNASAIKNYNMLKGESPIPVVIDEVFEEITKDSYGDFVRNATFNVIDFDEKEFISDERWGYIGTPTSFKINVALRNGDLSKLDDYQRKTIKTLEEVIDRNVINKNIIAVRNVDWNYVKSLDEELFDVIENMSYPSRKDIAEEVESWVNNYLTGNVIAPEGFSSASLVPDINVFRDRLITLKIEIPKGSHGYLTDNTFESELILQHGQKFEIKGATLKEVPDSRSLLTRTNTTVEILLRVVND